MKIIWLGHAAFRIEAGEAVILVDPFLSGNAKFREAGLDLEQAAAGLTHIALTHGHSDHVGDTIALARAKNVPVSANADLAAWLAARGVERLMPGNTGGTQQHGSYTLTFVQALHSSAVMEENGLSSSLGNPNGLIFHFAGAPTVYHLGDTDIFSDMQLIDELHRPAVGLVPIGDNFTMGGAVAALACRRYLNLHYAVPCHYGTFPLLDQTPEKFITAMKGAETIVKAPKIGEILEF